MQQVSKPTSLSAQLRSIITPNLFLNDEEYNDFLAFLKRGKMTKDENPEYHCCVFFIPFKQAINEIFIVHHKKAKQWIVPGGHIEKGELLENAVKREMKEELGMQIKKVGKPFLFSVMSIHNKGLLCKVHFDIWYVVPVQERLQIDFAEFNDVRWVKKQTAKKLITHTTYLQALDRMEICS